MRKKIGCAKRRIARVSLYFAAAILLGLCGFGARVPRAGDDTARFYGTWEAQVPSNGQTITLVSVHDANGYKDYVRQPSGNQLFGQGPFSAVDGKYKSSSAGVNHSGTYYFMGNDIAIVTTQDGQKITWRRVSTPAQPGPPGGEKPEYTLPPASHAPPSDRPGVAPIYPYGGPKASAQPEDNAPSAKYKPDPSVSPEVNAALAALQQKDSMTAWRDFTDAAQKGDSDGEFGLGAMLYRKLNPPGTGYYAQCEKWFLLAANHGNSKGMEFLGRFYYDNGVAVAGGINPGINNAPIPPALQAQAEVKFKQSREWFERAADKGDIYAMGNLALMLDGGIGGPRDAARAAELRAKVKAGLDAQFAQRATSDPGNLAMTAAWQAGHYADAIKNAQVSAEKGDANSEALLGRAYYEGVGVPRNYSTALFWLNKAVAQGNTDGMFFLGLMYEHARGVNQDMTKAMNLFDRAGSKGHRYAQMEAQGIRLQAQSDKVAAEARKHGGVEGAACAAAGGVSSPGECLKGGGSIDPFNAEQAASTGE